MEVAIDKITVGEGRRELRNIDDLAKSIKEIGLLNPITITKDFRLVAGYHRLTACKKLGWKTIPANVVDMDALKAELAEIDENLIRNELTVLERAEQLKRRKEIYEALHPETKQGVAGGKASGQARRTTAESAVVHTPSFVEDTAQKTGRAARTVFEEVQIATNLDDEVKEMIRDTEIADRKTDLLKLARMDKEEQKKVAAKIREGAKSLVDARRLVKKEDVKETPPLEGKYRVIYADPPWRYNDKRDGNTTGAEDHYPTMSIEELCNLPVRDLAEDNAVLFLWTTSPLLEDSFKVINAWGFKYKTSFVWDKVRHNMGHYNSVRHEFLLVATRGSCTPDNPKLFDSVVTIERSDKHSEKPERFREIIDTLYTHGRKIELFARKPAEGWEVWGNQV